MRPIVPAVQAAEHAIDLDSGPDDTMILRINQDAGDEGSANRTFAGDVYRKFLPVPPTVARAIDPGGARAGKQYIGFHRIDGQRPDCRQRTIGADPLPLRPTGAADEQAG